MRFHLLFMILLLGVFCLTLAQGSYDDCCLRYVKAVKHSVMKKVTSYRKQEMDGSCNIPAIMFILRRGGAFCGDPQKKWVQQLMKRVDNFQAGATPKSTVGKKHKKGSRG